MHKLQIAGAGTGNAVMSRLQIEVTAQKNLRVNGQSQKLGSASASLPDTQYFFPRPKVLRADITTSLHILEYFIGED